MACALGGLTVLDLSTGPAASLATMFLSDHGARVVRLIAPGTSHLRDGGYVVWDRGKACVTLDLDAALEGLDALSTAQLGVQACAPAADLLRLIANADILVEDFAPSSPRQRLVARAAIPTRSATRSSTVSGPQLGLQASARGGGAPLA